MTISGYTFVRNAVKLGYPLKESIQSILELVDEFVLAYVPGDDDDDTLEVIQSITSPKIKIIEAEWEPERFKQNTLYSYLSDVAKNKCIGEWLFYLQVDEVVHENYLPVIENACMQYVNKPEIEGLLFNYRHFWGDYEHCFTHHGWYPREIRVIRNLPEIHSWRDAQSFRYYDQFEATTEYYRKKEHTRKLNVALIPAEIFHYGWVRPPLTMSDKQNRMSRTWDPSRSTSYLHEFDYGNLGKVPLFKGTHPALMEERVKKLDWKDKLNYGGKKDLSRHKFKHEKIKYRIRSWIELNLLGGREIGGFRNYKIVAKFSGSRN
ncbi:MAG: hypothetical protein KDC79_11580 [Cyclobacteriaceae bacterium]|nr:hypothetical protein [Cyclobacteriaceae bacterium]